MAMQEREKNTLRALLDLTIKNKEGYDRFFTPLDIHYETQGDKNYRPKEIHDRIDIIKSDYVCKAVIKQGNTILKAYRANLAKRAEIEADLRR